MIIAVMVISAALSSSASRPVPKVDAPKPRVVLKHGRTLAAKKPVAKSKRKIAKVFDWTAFLIKKLNPIFWGHHDSLAYQNQRIDADNLARIEDAAQFKKMVRNHELVPLPNNKYVKIDEKLEPSRRYARPWTVSFLNDLGAAFYAEFGKPLQVNSAARDKVSQKKLWGHNKNAAPVEGEKASSHLAGITVDIAAKTMTATEYHWVENYLLVLRDARVLEPEEEFRQFVFHIAVFRSYADLYNDDETVLAETLTW